jgi:hypothetical protein
MAGNEAKIKILSKEMKKLVSDMVKPFFSLNFLLQNAIY